jgi:hypothetical protein
MKRTTAVLLPALCLFGMTFLPGLRSSANEDNRLPKVVARFDQLLRAADLPTTITLYTPEKAGLFRVSGYAVVTNLDPNGVFGGDFSFGWTDDASAKTQQEVAGNTGTFRLFFNQVGGYSSTSFVVRAIASTPITFSAANLLPTSTQGPGNNEFTVFFTIEKLRD